jgi:hypothetical protein
MPDNQPILQVQKEGEGLCLVLRGDWGRTRAATENFLATLGEAGIRTACDLEHGKQFKPPPGRFSLGAASAAIELDPAVLRGNNFAAVRALLNAVETDLACPPAAADFSRANIYEQVGKAIRLQPGEYPAAFGVSRDNAEATIARARNPQGVTVLSNAEGDQGYEVPQSDFRLARRIVEAPVERPPVTVADRDAARQKYYDQQVQILQLGENKADIVISFPAPSSDISTAEAVAGKAEAFRRAAESQGLTVPKTLVNGSIQGLGQLAQNGVRVSVGSAKQAFKLAQLLREEKLGFSEARVAEVAGSVKGGGRWDWVKKLIPGKS